MNTKLRIKRMLQAQLFRPCAVYDDVDDFFSTQNRFFLLSIFAPYLDMYHILYTYNRTDTQETML